jgi:hypothetical protein
MMDVCPVSNGRLLLLQKVLEEALCPEVWCEHLCAAAASTGQIQIMDWLMSTGCSKLTTTALEQAAHFGQSRVMEFCLYRQPELWTEEVAMCAARAGNTRVAPSGDLFTVISISKLHFQDISPSVIVFERCDYNDRLEEYFFGYFLLLLK